MIGEKGKEWCTLYMWEGRERMHGICEGEFGEGSEREVHVIFTQWQFTFSSFLMKQPLCRNGAGGIDNVS